MKTLSHTTFLFLLLAVLAIPSAAQVLVMKGEIKDSSEHSLQGYFELRNSKKQLRLGHCSKLKLKLDLNEEYTLTFSKPGYQSKSITISTYADSTWWHLFRFDVLLHKMNVTTDMKPEIVAGNVFYDPGLLTYNYIVYSMPSPGHTPREVKPGEVTRVILQKL